MNPESAGTGIPGRLVALAAALLVASALPGCAKAPVAGRPPASPPISRTAPSAEPSNEGMPAAFPLPGDEIAARSFIDEREGWAVGTDATLGSLVLHTADAGKHWTTQLRSGAGFPLVDVDFVDRLHGWAVSSTGTLVGNIIATDDGGVTWHDQGGYGPLETVRFTDLLNGVVTGSDGDSPQRPMTLTTRDGGAHWTMQYSK